MLYKCEADRERARARNSHETRIELPMLIADGESLNLSYFGWMERRRDEISMSSCNNAAARRDCAVCSN